MRGEATVSELAAPFSMTLPAVAKHLAVLEAAGLVGSAKRGRTRHCFLEGGALADADEWIVACRSFWAETLDSLAGYLEDHPPAADREAR